MQWTMKKYRRTREKPLPTITPHVLRHTFCTNMANAGMDLKSLQYLMGHSDAGITMNVYTHASFAQAEKSMQKILKFEPKPEAKTG
jgi:site-specific recombinase XerD